MLHVLCNLQSYHRELVVRMLLAEKLGLNSMQSKANEILNTENTMIFLLIIKKKNSDHLFILCSDDSEFCIEKSSKPLTLIYT